MAKKHPCATSNPPAWCNRKGLSGLGKSKSRRRTTKTGRAKRVCVKVKSASNGQCACAKYAKAGSSAARRASFKTLCGRQGLRVRMPPGRGGSGSYSGSKYAREQGSATSIYSGGGMIQPGASMVAGFGAAGRRRRRRRY